MSNGKSVEAEGYAYKTANGLNFALHKEGGVWLATETTSGKLATTNDHLTLKDVKAEIERRSATIFKLLQKEQSAKTPESKKKQKIMKKQKVKQKRPNPFAGADDVYLTKNKIAVTTVKSKRRNKVNETITKTKYYELNDSNKRSLRKVQKEVRRGRNGSKYETL